MDGSAGFSSSNHWEYRYRVGGTSGAGSHGRLARFKADVINNFVRDNKIGSVIDIGCGDGCQLGLLELPDAYVGVDVSPAALARCRRRFQVRRFVGYDRIGTLAQADLTMALDVLYHLPEDNVFVDTVHRIFALARRFVVIYSSNLDATWPSPHVRHRLFTRHVAATEPGWRLLAHMPNPYPFDPARSDVTSFADFFIYGRPGAPCVLHVPVAAED